MTQMELKPGGWGNFREAEPRRPNKVPFTAVGPAVVRAAHLSAAPWIANDFETDRPAAIFRQQKPGTEPSWVQFFNIDHIYASKLIRFGPSNRWRGLGMRRVVPRRKGNNIANSIE
jgi:hypothetical protein